MSDLTHEEKFIIEKLQEKGGKLNYRDLQTLCQNEFEGVRLILKKLKEKGFVEFEGIIPDFSAEIKLIKNI